MFLASDAEEAALDLSDIRLFVAFLSFTCGDRPRPGPRLDKVNSLFRVIFRILLLDDANPALSSLALTAKQSIVERSTAVPVPPPGQFDCGRFASFLRTLVPQDWIGLRNKTLTLYVLILGRRPSNATRALLPQSSFFRPWGVQITELGAKRDRSRQGTHVFVPSCSVPELCFVNSLRAYLAHPKTLAIHRAISSPSPPLFVQASPGQFHNHAIAKSTAGSIIKRLLERADCHLDVTGTVVHPKDIRPAVYSRCIREGSIPLSIVRHMQDWKQESVSDRHYLRGESPCEWPEFVLGLKRAPGESFCSLLSAPPHFSTDDASSALGSLHPSDRTVDSVVA
jgi:hypothetical protein